MELEELKNRLSKFELSEIKTTKHGFKRTQDKRRAINYPQVVSLLTSQKGLYKFQEQVAKSTDELKFKLWFELNYIYDMNVYIVITQVPQIRFFAQSVKTASSIKISIFFL